MWIKDIVLICKFREAHVEASTSSSVILAASESLFGFALTYRTFNNILFNDKGFVHTRHGTFMLSYIDFNDASRFNSTSTTTSKYDSATDNWAFKYKYNF